MYQHQGNYNNGNNGGGNNYPPSVNTNAFELTNVPMGCTTRLAYFNSTMSVAIGSFKEGITLDWKSMSELPRTQVNMGYGDLCELGDICDDIKDSIKKDGTFETTAIVCGGKRNNMIEISNGSNIDMPEGIYLVIYNNIGMNGTPQSMAVYTFAKTTVYKGYNSKTGESTSHEVKQGEFKKFRKAVNKAADAMTMAEAHAGERAHMKEKTDTHACLEVLAQALGATPQMQRIMSHQRQRTNNGGGQVGGAMPNQYANYGASNHIQEVANSGYGEELDLPNNV